MLVILLQKWSAGLHFGQGEIITQTMASQRGVGLWNIAHFSPPSCLASPYAEREKGQSHCPWPSHLFLPSAGTPCTSGGSEHRSAGLLRRSSGLPSTICEITGQNLAQKVRTSTSSFRPAWPCLREYKHLVPKGQFRSYSVASCRCCTQIF